MRRLWFKIKTRLAEGVLLLAQLYVVGFLVGAALTEPRWDLHLLAVVAGLTVLIRIVRETL